MRRLASPALLLALACNTGFAPQYRVTDLRILAVRAEVVPAQPGAVTAADPTLDDTVLLKALVANPLGHADLRVRWFACAPGASGALPPCVDPEVLRDPSSLAAAGAFELPGPPPPETGEQLPPLALSTLPQPVREALQRALDAASALAQAQPAYRCRVYVELPLVVIAQAGGRQEVAVKRVRLVPNPPAPNYPANRNPVVRDASSAPDDTCVGATSLSLPAALRAGGATTLCAQAGDPPESYDVCGPDGPIAPQAKEPFAWQWYVTAGEFPDVGGLGNAEGSDLVFVPPPARFTLWLLLRDGRGGVDWKAFEPTPAP